MLRLEEQYAATAPHEPKEVIHLLKSDTQGHEIGVLRGARNLLWERRVRFVLVEMDLSLAGGRAAGDKVIRYLASYGFVCCDMKWHDDTGRPYEGSHGIGNSTLVGHWDLGARVGARAHSEAWPPCVGRRICFVNTWAR
tara:strand:- start:870 stop:1286 length:417 start_codon:yes stop_codon:yes gene_type:complete